MGAMGAMDSSCVPAGIAHLLAFGAGIALVVLSPWLVLWGRAVYRDGPALQRWVWNAGPPWVLSTTGFIVLFGFGRTFAGWADLCLPGREWNAVGVLFIGIGGATALIAVARMIVGRIRVGNGARQTENSDKTNENSDETSTQPAHSVEAAPPARTRNMPVEQRRVIITYVLTYAAAVIVIIVGVGLL